jgi:hypothetical protein
MPSTLMTAILLSPLVCSIMTSSKARLRSVNARPRGATTWEKLNIQKKRLRQSSAKKTMARILQMELQPVRLAGGAEMIGGGANGGRGGAGGGGGG